MVEEIGIKFETKWGEVIISDQTPPYFIQNSVLLAVFREDQYLHNGIPADWTLLLNLSDKVSGEVFFRVYKVMELEPILSPLSGLLSVE